MSTHRWSGALVIALTGLAACASAPKSPLYGTWRVTSYASPGGSGRGSVPALAWIGISATFAANDARVGADRCGSPSYTPRTLSAADFQKEYRVATTALGIAAEPVTVFDLKCGVEWTSPANTLVLKSPDTLLAQFEGTFFEMVKR